MDLHTASPVQIDTRLADLYYDSARISNKIGEAADAVFRVAGMRRETDRHSFRSSLLVGTLAEAEVAAERIANGEDDRPAWDVRSARSALDTLAALRAETATNTAAQAPLHAEFRARGGWTRAFLVVTKGKGHVHSSMSCSTCYPTTQYAWMVEYSGQDEAEIVDAAGERACTVCYPSAPVEVLAKPTRMFSAKEITAQQARQERAAAKVAREEKRLAKALLPSGEELVVEIGQRTTYSGREYMQTEKFGTLVSARTWLTDAAMWNKGGAHPSYPVHAVQTVAEAVAAKEAQSVEVVLAEAAKRAEKRR